MIVVFWGITPLQSAIFASRTKSQRTLVPVKSFSPLLPLEEQATALSSSFITTAFGVTWLGEELPGFVTRDLALQPVDLGDAHKNNGTTWTVPTISYSSELNCTAATTILYTSDITQPVYHFQDDLGCTQDFPYPPFYSRDSEEYFLEYYGFPSDSFSPKTTSDALSCTGVSKPTALTVWAHRLKATQADGYPVSYNLSASFFRATYYTQDVSATINGANFTVLSIKPSNPKLPLLETIFNSTSFESAFLTGFATSSKSKDQPDRLMIDIDLKLPPKTYDNVHEPVAFALSLSSLSIEQLSDQALRQSAFNTAHNLLFALAINELQGSPQPLLSERTGIISLDLNAIVIVRVFAIIVECLLGIVGSCSLLLLVSNWRRESQMINDPASIEDIGKLLSTEVSTLDEFLNLHNADTRKLEAAIQGKEYRLQGISNARRVNKTSTIKKIIRE